MADQRFDVFLCHNSEDKSAVIKIAEQLQAQGIKPWLDEWELRPGLDWQDALDGQIEQIQTAAVFVGNAGLGPWQQQEIKSVFAGVCRARLPGDSSIARQRTPRTSAADFSEG